MLCVTAFLIAGGRYASLARQDKYFLALLHKSQAFPKCRTTFVMPRMAVETFKPEAVVGKRLERGLWGVL